MEEQKKKIALFFTAACMIGLLSAQKDSIFKTGLIRAQANISGGYLFHSKKYAPYISANMDYYMHENFSINGEAWFSFDIINKETTGLRKNFSTFLGMNYHPVKFSRWDPYIGVGAGMAFYTLNYYKDTLIRESPPQFAPVVGITAGLNYYIGTIFHFFVQCKFVAGSVGNSEYGRAYMEELKISGGLGWNLKPKKRNPKKIL